MLYKSLRKLDQREKSLSGTRRVLKFGLTPVKFLNTFSLNTSVARESPFYLLTENNIDQMNLEDYGPDGI